jgi:hypothetical protein
MKKRFKFLSFLIKLNIADSVIFLFEKTFLENKKMSSDEYIYNLPETSWEMQALKWKVETIRPLTERTQAAYMGEKELLEKINLYLRGLQKLPPSPELESVLSALSKYYATTEKKVNHFYSLFLKFREYEMMSIENTDALHQFSMKPEFKGFANHSPSEIYMDFKQSPTYIRRMRSEGVRDLMGGKTFYEL